MRNDLQATLRDKLAKSQDRAILLLKLAVFMQGVVIIVSLVKAFA